MKLSSAALRNNNIHQPTIHAVTKHATQPDNDEVLVVVLPSCCEVFIVNFGDGIIEPIHDAIGSASAKHSTEYRTIIILSVINPGHIVIAVPTKK
mmetsp:Transcript_30330/g.34444  ORF Transcript_30330/g.34444 Transcript_30330/m.34444 type:complete len:95 (-) Transcript_30330:503-787(-)